MTATAAQRLVARARSALGRRSVGGVAREAGRRAVARVSLREEHVWYELRLDADLPAPPPLEPPLELARAGDDLRHKLEDLGQSAAGAREYADRGNDHWLVMEGDKPAFSCWIFRAETPVAGTRGGWMPLPDGTVCLEHSVTSPDFRGRGVAPRAWGAIAAALRDEGVASMITKVAVENAPSRKAVTKAGFAEVALMRLVRRGVRTHVDVDVLAPTGTATALAERLRRG